MAGASAFAPCGHASLQAPSRLPAAQGSGCPRALSALTSGLRAAQARTSLVAFTVVRGIGRANAVHRVGRGALRQHQVARDRAIQAELARAVAGRAVPQVAL
jgi:hypothetical protein